ncbi:MAG: GIY-YIG nuclease family protein [Candidatus Magasanikbacteria bacterium]|nr:GIY-YIG nuclease family protein [Candidatus Magasanikbacteria bacterium]
MIKDYYVYIMTNDRNGTLYTGVTNSLFRRVWEHKEKIKKGTFTDKYDIDMLVYYEGYTDPENAIMREKQIKAGSRKKKIALIEKMNPQWKDLSADF